jgi:ketosteroid isomerase-like protein
MVSWFTEDSIVPLITGVFLAITFFALAFSFRDKVMFYVGLVVALLTAATVITETLIVTDQEAVREVVYQLADCVRSNDSDGVIAYVKEGEELLTKDIRQNMAMLNIESCNVLGFVSFETEEEGKPQTANIDFSVWGNGQYGRSGRFTGRRRVVLDLEKDAKGNWKISDYDHFDPGSNVNL